MYLACKNRSLKSREIETKYYYVFKYLRNLNTPEGLTIITSMFKICCNATEIVSEWEHKRGHTSTH
jgi:hypothetical protein